MARVQQVTLVPLLFLEALNLHIASIVALTRRRDRPALVEAGLLVGHAALFFVAPFLVLPPLRAALFVLVTQVVFGFYLGASFLINHVGMPSPYAGEELGVPPAPGADLPQSVRGHGSPATCSGDSTARSSTTSSRPCPGPTSAGPGPWSAPSVRSTAVAYTEQTPWDAYREVLRHLRAVGAGRLATTAAPDWPGRAGRH